ncbi:NUDIX domain-containing protein [Streptomyces sp. H27-D2]|uniref:NUDIX domain-containing protein n=1 Tax=Streptomyces sp. H27-D2 TaxID=3046304 RepID=UPI002DB8776A|nr:NUDIX domain-containing protein [Streptomyces sp. H27-D2]MEC4017380.1 NUDIX domain-containing protein [Streptomyces sp. H27-D2]
MVEPAEVPGSAEPADVSSAGGDAAAEVAAGDAYERGGVDGLSPPDRLEFVQKAFILDDDRLLMVRKSAADPRHPTLWEVPGGRMTLGEDADTHVRREVWEETGVAVSPGRPFYLWEWTMSDPQGAPGRVQLVAVARECEAQSTELSTDHQVPGDHLDEARWVPLSAVDSYDLIPDLKPVLEQFLRSRSGV